MLKRLLLSLCLVLVGAMAAYAQSSCSCARPGGCSASQTCPSGYIAVCDCEATLCSSKCEKIVAYLLERQSNAAIAAAIKESSPDKLNEILSRSMGRPMVFEPSAKDFRFDYIESKSSTGSHWDILEYLAARGKITINGINIDSWRIMHETLLNGGEHSICFNDAPASMILNHISFLSGKRYVVMSGDPQTRISGPLTGNGTDELIEKLKKLANIIIVEN